MPAIVGNESFWPRKFCTLCQKTQLHRIDSKVFSRPGVKKRPHQLPFHLITEGFALSIQFEAVSKIYRSSGKQPEYRAVDDVSLHIEKGEFVVFLGPSGCGKSTMLRMVNGLEDISLGRILINGQSNQEIPEIKLRQSIGYVIQQIGLFPNKTVAENIGIVPKMLGWSKTTIADRVKELLSLINLKPELYLNRYPFELSGGQQQRVGVARALAADPEILLMDEPFGAIDPINRDQIQDEFLSLQDKLKKTIICVSHDIHEAIKMADKIAIFRAGKLVQCDTPEGILTQPEDEFVADFVGADAGLKILSLMRVKDNYNPALRNVYAPHQQAHEVFEDMQKNQFKMGIVAEHQKIIGYVTPREIRKERGRVGQLCRPVNCVARLHDTLRDVLSEMLLNEYAMLCVVDKDDKLKGTISYKYIQNAITEMLTDD